MGFIEQKTFRSKNDTDILIRNGEEDDADEIIGINKSVLEEKYFMLREPSEATYTTESMAKEIIRHREKEGSLYIVSEVNGKVTGYLEFQNGLFKRTSHSGMFSMFILKEFRETGIGSMLLETLLEWAENNPLMEKVALAVFSTNIRAQNLYMKYGFKEEGRCPRDMKLDDGTYIDSVLMYKFVK